MIKIAQYNILCLLLGYLLLLRYRIDNKLIKMVQSIRYHFKKYNLKNIILVCYYQFINLYSKSNYNRWDSPKILLKNLNL